MSDPSPHELYAQTGGGPAYRIAMLEHGHTVPTPPWDRGKLPGKRAEPCGLIHLSHWSEWRIYRVGDRDYEGRWCRVCAHTNVRYPAALQAGASTPDGQPQDFGPPTPQP